MMAANHLAIEVRGLTKRFRRISIQGGHTTLKTQLVKWMTAKRGFERVEHNDIEVLRGIDLTVPVGETVGIVGVNGSGKSTLLKILAGIYAPTSGTASMRGRVAALLELGAGFHPEFSGRENVLINGVILGLSRREIARRLDAIVAFSELGDFIDAPVRTYSSGMFMRLAFAVATHVDADVLLLDEVLSVGDEHFARKCRTKMDEFRAAGKTIVLVSHSLQTIVERCARAVWIADGRVAASGDPRSVVTAYQQSVSDRENAAMLREEEEKAKNRVTKEARRHGALREEEQPDKNEEGSGIEVHDLVGEAAPAAEARVFRFGERLRWGTREAEITGVTMKDDAGAPRLSFRTGDAAELEIAYKAHREGLLGQFGIAVHREDGTHVYGTNFVIDGMEPISLRTSGIVRIRIAALNLLPGNYAIDVAVSRNRDPYDFDYQRGVLTFSIWSERAEAGVARLDHQWIAE